MFAKYSIVHRTSALLAEIVEFCRFLEPTLEEDEARREALLRITEIVCSMFPAAEVKTFGSYVTGKTSVLHGAANDKAFLHCQLG